MELLQIKAAIKAAIIDPITNAFDTVAGIIGDILGLFVFDWSLPKLKLPHLKITGDFSIAPPSVPKFSISWYTAKTGLWKTYGFNIGEC